MRVIDFITIANLFPVRVAILLILQIYLISFHVRSDVMLLQVIFVLHDEHVLIGHHVVCLVWDRVVEVVAVVIMAKVVLLG